MSSRRHQPHLAGGVNLGLIITPMLDMSFQILSFFIMTYHPSALEGHIAGSLAPPADYAKKAPEMQQMDVIPDSVPEEALNTEVQEAPTVMIKTGGNAEPGKPDKVLLRRNKTETEPVQVADVSVSWANAKADLARELRRLKKEGGEQSDIKIEADGELRQEYVMEVYDICKQSGFPKIHFVPPPQLRGADKQ